MGWFTKQESETNPEYGQIPEKRSIQELMDEGFVIVDKPLGPTSNQVTSWIKKELDLNKTGHFGTLDPNATGVLPVGMNRGTRINKALAKADKKYVFEAKLEDKIDSEKIKQALTKFQGVNKQVPPKKSAVKREEREREVYDIQLLETKENMVLGKVHCESGFYVRTLIEQLANKLGTKGEMTELRRTKQGKLTEDQSSTLQDIVDAYHYYKDDQNPEPLKEILQPIEKAVQHLPKIVIKDSAVNAVANGADLGVNGISKLEDGIKPQNTVAITTLKGELVALATAEMNTQKMYEGVEGTAATLQNVYMDPETYPKRWKQEG